MRAGRPHVLAIACGLGLILPVACTQILGVEEGRYEGFGVGGAGGAASSSVVGSVTNSGTGSAPCTVECNPPPTCQVLACSGAICEYPLAPVGTPCPAGSCTQSGACVACMNPTDCGTNNACATFSCEAGLCMADTLPADTEVSDPVQHDCLHEVCNGSTDPPIMQAFDDPPQSAPECNYAACVEPGAVVYLPESSDLGDFCGSGGVCERNGTCSDCATPADCASSGFGPLCLAGECGCNTSADCAGNIVGGPLCGTTNRCGCTSASQCTSNERGDECLGTSTCGCFTASDCLNVPGKPVCGENSICVVVTL